MVFFFLIKLEITKIHENNVSNSSSPLLRVTPEEKWILTPCEILPTADIKCWQAHRDRGQKYRRAYRERGQIGHEPTMTVVNLVASLL